MTFKNIITATAFAALTLPGCLTPASAGSAGTSAFQFLQLGVGARPSAMGETFAGVADDINAIYWNPAGLAGIARGELTMTHALWFQDITYSNIAYGQPALGGTIGVAFNTLNTGDIQKADNTGARLNESYGMSDVMGLVSYARSWNKLALGANLKYISSLLEEESAQSAALDLGAYYSGFRPWGKQVNAGISVQNLGTAAKYVSESSPLPVIIRAGGSMSAMKDLLVAADLVYAEEAVNLHFGAEYTHKVNALILAVRAGYKGDTVKALGALSGITAGLGVKWNDYQFDYAWNSFTDLGVTHRITVGMKFGGITNNKEEPSADKIIRVIR